MSLTISTAKVNITPTLQTDPYLAGYGCAVSPRLATTNRAHAPLYIRCVVIWDNSVPKVIASCDVLAFGRSMHQSIRQRVIALNDGWTSADFILQATHTHNGPVLIEKLEPTITYDLSDLTTVTSYSSWLEDQAVDAVDAALAAPQTPVTLDYQVAAETFAFNRAGLAYAETAVPILTARDGTGEPVAVVFSYGCHPVSAGLQDRYDGDWPAGACSYIEQALPDCFALFLQGPAGDQDPAGDHGWALRDNLASQLGRTVMAAIDSVGRSVTGPIVGSYSEVNLPLDITIDAANLTAVRADYVTRLANPAGQPEWYQRHAQKMIAIIDASSIATTVPLPLQVWKMQADPLLRWAMVGGELTSGYAAYFRGRYGGPPGILVCGYANEIPGYIPSNELLPPLRTGGSYEGGWDTDFPGLAGGSMTVYGLLGHFKAGNGGVEATLIQALEAQLA